MEQNLSPNLPIRIVKHAVRFVQDEQRISRPSKCFLPENERLAHKKKLIEEVKKIDEGIKSNTSKFPRVPNIIKAKLRDDALAKTYRPTDLLSKDTCPIIGLDRQGELLLRVTEDGLNRLEKKIPIVKYNIEANTTAIENFRNFDTKEKLRLPLEELEKISKRDGVTCLKVILFDYENDELNKYVENEFREWAKQKGFKTEMVCELLDIKILKLTGLSKTEMQEVIEHPAVKELSFFPAYQVVEPAGLQTEFETPALPKFDSSRDYPQIGIIDSGVPETHPILKPWLIAHYSYVLSQVSNNSHGTAVASLACLGHVLNPGLYLEDDPVRFFDLQVLPNSDHRVGPVELLSEDKLIARIMESVPEFSELHKIKIWNMSMGLEKPCSDEKFSHLAAILDELQDKYNIIITVPSGNAKTYNRSWPARDYGDLDRLQIPADSVRSISVGAIAFSKKANSIVDIGQPTSYSCKGPGPAFLTKPELVHYSGNNSFISGNVDFSGQGMRVWDPNGNIAEKIGTSLSTPLLSRTLSLLENKILSGASSNLLKAIIIHHASHPDSLGNVSENKKFQYAGFGKPTSIANMLNCHPHQITLVFEGDISAKKEFNYDFLWPRSLVNNLGGYKGNVRMTLASEPPLAERYGPEYIRANVSAALQMKVTRKNKNGGFRPGWKSIVGEVFDSGDIAEDLSPQTRYERELIKKNKWKPIKKYEGSFRRTKLNKLRIHVSLLLRSGEILKKPVKFALIFTLSDPDEREEIYKEVIRDLNSINIVTNEIQLRPEIKQKLRIK